MFRFIINLSKRKRKRWSAFETEPEIKVATFELYKRKERMGGKSEKDK
jgi:hypothetical protein